MFDIKILLDNVEKNPEIRTYKVGTKQTNNTNTNLLKFKVMKTTNNKPSAKLNKAIDNVANVFEDNTNSNYMGCRIHVSRKQEPFKYVTNTGKPATKSARYWGYIEYPNGEREEFANARGGAIARLCGIYVREEHEARDRATKNGEIWECARKFFRENK